MTPDALHKRAERQRRSEAGEVRVEVWLDQKTFDQLKWLEENFDESRAEVITIAVQWLRSAHERDG